MYFNEKGDTNIDSEFESKNKFSLKNLNLNLKPILIIGGAIVLLIIIILIIATIMGNSKSYRIELIGEQRIVLNLGDDYIEPGYKAYDKKNKDVSTDVKIKSNIDIYTPGNYEISYEINGINVVRYITIIEKSQETYIQLLGNKTIRLNLGESFVEPGYKVFDNIDKNLEVKVTGSVNTSKKGTYQITYTVTNSRNFTTSATRIVIVE